MQITEKYKLKNSIRIVTAASLFDGHDAAINIIRRILQSTGAEVIHLGHNRSAAEIIDTAIQEDAQAIAVSSYQGGHIEFFKYMYDLLIEKKAEHIKIFGGGGGVILPAEQQELHQYGIEQIYSVDDGRKLGLQGMINDVLQRCDNQIKKINRIDLENIEKQNVNAIAEAISFCENNEKNAQIDINKIKEKAKLKNIPVIGFTGTGGAGKSSLLDELIRRYLMDFPEKSIAIVSIDPTKRKTGGALLGDRIRMNSIYSPNVYMRSLATRQNNQSVSQNLENSVNILKIADYDLIFIETSGIGQSDSSIVDLSDLSVYVMTSEFGAPTQLEKIDMIDFADFIVLNKSDKRGAADALRDVRKQYARSRELWHENPETFPVFATIASQYNDNGINQFYKCFIQKINELKNGKFNSTIQLRTNEKTEIIPQSRIRYLSEISESVRNYNKWTEEQRDIAQKLQSLNETLRILDTTKEHVNEDIPHKLEIIQAELSKKISPENKNILQSWELKKKSFENEFFTYKVRDKEFKIETHTETLSHLKIPKIALPQYNSWGDILKWNLQENVPGEFPFTAGVFPFKREEEDPTRMFAGEGGPERTNKRFHYVSKGMPAKRLSTAFDSVTLYGEDPDYRPDIYGKIGNSGVSIACMDDAKKLYSGFRLCDEKTSVSMTINGPAPILVGYFMNAAIDQECEMYIRQNGLENTVLKQIEEFYKNSRTERPVYRGELPEGNNGLGLMLLGTTGKHVLPLEIYERIKSDTLCKVRGTIQADILKEDQAQNTCIFSTDFSLKLMGDIQEYFILNNIQNFYSVSISGYHIAEAGANPITQLAFTLANGFTYIEYYLSRGMNINKFAPNLSFFFSNGIDPEYSVIGRVARRIWAKTLKFKYNADVRSQKLKYHIQTSGRSLHAQEIDFNDIRTTLQAVYAIFDNCNSLHTNAYDEAITTPTEDSVRRAMAIQMIINHELGLAKNQNPLQGSFIIEKLTDLVEEAVMIEFDRITERGGVLGAMETMYQRNKIQEESLYYETMKHSGKLPIMGVNTFLSGKGSPTIIPGEVIRATKQEKDYQIFMLNQLHNTYSEISHYKLNELKNCAVNNSNVFEKLMEVTQYCSIGQITKALYEAGGQYRRNM